MLLYICLSGSSSTPGTILSKVNDLKIKVPDQNLTVLNLRQYSNIKLAFFTIER